GYEISFQCSKNVSSVQIVRLDGALGSFSYVATTNAPGLSDGDVVMATIAGSVITAYINGAQVLQGTDSTYAKGNPGMGFYLNGPTDANRDYGFTDFIATNGTLG